MKCNRCGTDPRPIIVGGIIMKPCGLVRDEDQMPFGEYKIEGCPVSEWQDGYAACLSDKKQENELQG